MRYFAPISRKLLEAQKDRRIFLFLDFDGTLAPIVKTPRFAKLPVSVKKDLCAIACSGRFKIAIISGRTLEDVKKRVGIEGIIYVGNHGFEIEGPKIKFKSFADPDYFKMLKDIKKLLKDKTADFKGVMVEDKGYSIALHYRAAAQSDVPCIKTAFQEATFTPEVRGRIRTRCGKKIFEVLPPQKWNKGEVVMWLLGRERVFDSGDKGRILPVYIGDDVTDEDAFKALRGKGITIFVGSPVKSAAAYYLNDCREVGKFLSDIASDAKRRIWE